LFFTPHLHLSFASHSACVLNGNSLSQPTPQRHSMPEFEPGLFSRRHPDTMSSWLQQSLKSSEKRGKDYDVDLTLITLESLSNCQKWSAWSPQFQIPDIELSQLGTYEKDEKEILLSAEDWKLAPFLTLLIQDTFPVFILQAQYMDHAAHILFGQKSKFPGCVVFFITKSEHNLI
jgi:hypothetical protein